MDRVMQVAWTALAVAAVLVAWRRRPPRGLWPLVAAACVVIAVDKAIDLQTQAFTTGKELARTALAAVGLAEARQSVKAALLVAATLVVLMAMAWAVRRTRRPTRGELLACAGLGVVALLVGLRFVPGMSWLADVRVGWTCEALACALLAAGCRDGFRRCDRTD